MTRQIAIFGGSFNPPGKHHRTIAQRLTETFDEVIVVPCGPRPDKATTNDTEPVHRATMVDMAFRNLDRVRVDLSDLETATFSRAYQLEDRFRDDGTLWHAVTADFVIGGAQGASQIHRQWERGAELWKASHFAIVKSRDRALPQEDLPPQHRVIEVDCDGSSLDLRSTVFQRRDTGQLLPPAVAAYIDRHGLYRPAPPRRHTSFVLSERRIALVIDESSPRARELAAPLARYVDGDAQLIVVVGGDGTMLSAIRAHWRQRLPFFGLNAGHLGFLLNDDGPLSRRDDSFVLEQLPLLHVEVEDLEGSCKTALAFNDAWVERATGQTAWIKVSENGQTRLETLVADGAPISTAAGSTAYARAMGATPLPLSTPAVLLVGSNVLRPTAWRPVVLPLESTIELSTIDEHKRPLEGYIDGVPQGRVRRMTARISRVASVELAFHRDTDLAGKLARIQFPSQ